MRQGTADRLTASLRPNLSALKADVIVARGLSLVAQFVKKATKTIPIVMPSVADPVETGLVASLAQPGGNITGLATFHLN